MLVQAGYILRDNISAFPSYFRLVCSILLHSKTLANIGITVTLSLPLFYMLRQYAVLPVSQVVNLGMD